MGVFRIEWQSRIRLVDEVAAVLRESIYAGRYPPGTRLRQEELAAQLGVSRTPLREAMRILERERLVELDGVRGVRVLAAEPATLRSAYELREVVDGLAARLAAANRPEGLGERLREIVAKQRETLVVFDPVHYTAANVEFHATVVDAAQNEFVAAQLPLIQITSRVFAPVAHLDASRAELAVGEHLEITDAIEAGAEQDAERLARAHIRRTMASLPG